MPLGFGNKADAAPLDTAQKILPTHNRLASPATHAVIRV